MRVVIAVVREFWASKAVESAMKHVPTTTPGPAGELQGEFIPVTEVPGCKPRLPVTTVDPVFVTVEPPRTAKELAFPR